MATCGTNVCHTQATDTTLLEFLSKWMPLHSVYTMAKKRKGSPIVQAIEFEFAMQKRSKNYVIAVALLRLQDSVQHTIYN